MRYWFGIYYGGANKMLDIWGLKKGLKDARTMLGMTQVQLAVRLGVKQPSVSQYESPDSTELPTLQVFAKYLAALGSDGKRMELCERLWRQPLPTQNR
jgi:transcriptional regulator with XRE-family HTH domain